MGRTIGRKELSELIHDRLGGSVSASEIYTAIGVIVEEVADLLTEGPVTAKNFGTLSPYLFHGHLALNVSSGEIKNTEPVHSVRFHPSVAFEELLSERIKKFRK